MNLSRRSLIGPALATGAGFALFASTSAIVSALNLRPNGATSLFMHYTSGVWMFLALAWLVARCCDLFLRRLSIISHDGAPYPRLLTDLLRAAFFAIAAALILLVVFEQPATGLITVSSVVIAVVGFALRNVISDLFSGIALGVDHPYRIGAWIETVQGSAGRVSEITWRTTRMTERNGFTIVLPNGVVAGQRLINYSGGERDYRTACACRWTRRCRPPEPNESCCPEHWRLGAAFPDCRPTFYSPNSTTVRPSMWCGSGSRTSDARLRAGTMSPLG